MINLEYLGWNGAATGGSPGRIWFIFNIQVGMEQLLEVLQEGYGLS